MELLYKDRTEQLIRGFFIVQNEVGLGRNEEAYQRAFEIWAAEQNLTVFSKPPSPLTIEGHQACILYPDFVAWHDLIVELKALPRRLGASEELQLFDYLRARQCRLGLIVNMGLDRVHVERRIYDPPPTQLVENWEHWRNRIVGQDREIAAAIHRAFHVLYASHQTGYSQAVTEKLVLGALTSNHLSVQPRPIAKAMFHQKVVHESAIECFVIEDRFALTLTANFDSDEFAKSLGLSHLNALDLPWGIAANFGRTDLQLTALRHRQH
jgi:GxxExxY protein